jgi:hypothetical protein
VYFYFFDRQKFVRHSDFSDALVQTFHESGEPEFLADICCMWGVYLKWGKKEGNRKESRQLAHKSRPWSNSLLLEDIFALLFAARRRL